VNFKYPLSSLGSPLSLEGEGQGEGVVDSHGFHLFPLILSFSLEGEGTY